MSTKDLIYAIIYCGGAILLFWSVFYIGKNRISRWERVYVSVLSAIIMLRGIFKIFYYEKIDWDSGWINFATMFVPLGMGLGWFVFLICQKLKKPN